MKRNILFVLCLCVLCIFSVINKNSDAKVINNSQNNLSVSPRSYAALKTLVRKYKITLPNKNFPNNISSPSSLPDSNRYRMAEYLRELSDKFKVIDKKNISRKDLITIESLKKEFATELKELDSNNNSPNIDLPPFSFPYPHSTDGTLVKKPAIYLYPEKSTEINILLDKSIKIMQSIPKYEAGKGWTIRANPDGLINDLKPKVTDCKKINAKFKDLKLACENGAFYPYIFWEGTKNNISIKENYENKIGWVVKRSELKDFLEKRLGELALNEREKKDFIDYWLDELLSPKNLKYKAFHISFLQNEQVDDIYPMSVQPEPVSRNRILMTVIKLSKARLADLKEESFKAQNLKPVIRNGFTLVEWGGMDI